MKQARSVRDKCSMSSGIQAGNYSMSTALLEADDSSPEKSVSVFLRYHDVNISTSWTEFATGTEG